VANGDWGEKIDGGWFSEEGHIYRDEEGHPVISSTQVFDVLGMSDFSMIPPAVLEFKRNYGTALHACSQFLVLKDLDWDTVDDRLIAPLTGIEQFLKKVEYISEATEEKRIVSMFGMKYGMTLDHRGTMIFQGKRRPVVADLKTGVKASQTWVWQIGSYLYPQPKMDSSWMGLIIQVDPEGKVTPHFVPDVEKAKREFQILLAAANLKINAGMAKIGKA
jgi:hypothetical protein